MADPRVHRLLAAIPWLEDEDDLKQELVRQLEDKGGHADEHAGWGKLIDDWLIHAADPETLSRFEDMEIKTELDEDEDEYIKSLDEYLSRSSIHPASIPVHTESRHRAPISRPIADHWSDLCSFQQLKKDVIRSNGL